MRRTIAILGLTAPALIVAASFAPAKMIALKPAAQRALTVPTVVVGKVTAIEKETVDALPFPKAPNKQSYKVAVVQVETALAGAKNVTHIKVGFIPPPPPRSVPPGGIRPFIRRYSNSELKVGQEFVFFLSKHPDAGFYVMPNMSPPLDAKSKSAKQEIEMIEKALTVVDEPMKALKAKTAEDRAFAATMLVSKYRAYPDGGGTVVQSPIPADESRLILKGLADADWAKLDRSMPNPLQVFYSLGLTKNDGWMPPKPMAVRPGQPAVNFNVLTKQAFVKWLDGPGKNYRIKQYISKKK